MREMVHQNTSASVELASSAEQLNSQADKFQQIVSRFIFDGSEVKSSEFKVRSFEKVKTQKPKSDGGSRSKFESEVEAVR
jgi:hypothetical protein